MDNVNVRAAARRLRDCGSAEERDRVMDELMATQPDGPGTAVVDLITRCRGSVSGRRVHTDEDVYLLLDEVLATAGSPLVLTQEETLHIIERRRTEHGVAAGSPASHTPDYHTTGPSPNPVVAGGPSPSPSPSSMPKRK